MHASHESHGTHESHVSHESHELGRLLLRLENVRALPEERLGRFHERLGERRVRMNAELEVRRAGGHLDRYDTLGDQLTGARADDTDAQNPLSLRIDDELRQTVR